MKKYEELYRVLKDRIKSGVLKEGERLLSIREEALASGLSVNTVIKAYELLTDEGFISVRERGGYYVRSGVLDLINGGFGITMPCAKRFESTARESGERVDQLYERLLHIDSSFACAAPDLDILPTVQLKKIASSLGCSWMEYGNPEGDYSLKHRIALINREIDGSSSADDIVITNGATEAIMIVMQCLLRPGDGVALESPTYMNFFRQLAPLGVDITEIPVVQDGMDLGILEEELKKGRIRMVVVQPNVQNPTGVTMSDSSKQTLVSLAEKYKIYLVQDDVYGDLSFSHVRPLNLTAFSHYSGLILVSSYSKSISPGLRIGWIRSPHFARQFTEEKLRGSMDSCRAAQAILVSFIGTSVHRRHLKSIRKTLEFRIDDHIRFLSEILSDGCSVHRPSGGCLLWISLPPGLDGTRIFEVSARKGLIAAPGELFSGSHFFNNYIRLNAGMRLTKERMKLLHHLGDSAKDYLKGKLK